MISIIGVLKLVLLSLFVYLFFLILKPFIPAIVLALTFAIVFYPLCGKAQEKWRLSPAISSFFVTLLTFLFILVPILLLIFLIGKEAVSFVQTLDIEKIKQEWLGAEHFYFMGYELELTLWKEKFFEILKQIGTYLSSKSITIVSSVSNSVFLFFVFLLLYYYFLKDAAFLLNHLKKLLPYPSQQQERLFTTFREISRTIFYGNFLSALISGIFAYAGFWLFGFEGALIWALLVAILSFIPAAGTLFVYLPGSLILLIGSGWMAATGLLVYFILMEILLRENWIRPKLMEDKLNLHPILVFLALVGGVSAFGSMGLIYGPLIITFAGALWQFYGSENP